MRLVGLVVFAVFAASTAGQLSLGRVPERLAMPAGCGALIAGMGLLALSLGGFLAGAARARWRARRFRAGPELPGRPGRASTPSRRPRVAPRWRRASSWLPTWRSRYPSWARACSPTSRDCGAPGWCSPRSWQRWRASCCCSWREPARRSAASRHGAAWRHRCGRRALLRKSAPWLVRTTIVTVKRPRGRPRRSTGACSRGPARMRTRCWLT